MVTVLIVVVMGIGEEGGVGGEIKPTRFPEAECSKCVLMEPSHFQENPGQVGSHEVTFTFLFSLYTKLQMLVSVLLIYKKIHSHVYFHQSYS